MFLKQSISFPLDYTGRGINYGQIQSIYWKAQTHPLFRETCHDMYTCRLLLFFACNLGCSNWEKETFVNKFEIEVDPMGCSSNRCKCTLRVCVIFSIFRYTWSHCTVKNKKENFVVEIQRKGNSVCTWEFGVVIVNFGPASVMRKLASAVCCLRSVHIASFVRGKIRKCLFRARLAWVLFQNWHLEGNLSC